MKKQLHKLLIVSIIIILFLGVMENDVYGFSNTDVYMPMYEKLLSINSLETEDLSSDGILEDLQEWYGYEGTNIKSTMVFNTTITVHHKGNSGNYWIYIGSNTGTLLGSYVYKTTQSYDEETYTDDQGYGMKFDKLQDIYGYDGTQADLDEAIKDGNTFSWDAVLVVECKRDDSYEDYTQGDGSIFTIWRYQYSFYITEVYVGEVDYGGLRGRVDSDENNEILDIYVTATGTDASGVVEGIVDAVSSVLTFAEKMMNNPAGTIGNLIADLIRNLFDAIQSIFNLFQTITLHTATDIDLVMYEYQDLIDDANGTYSDNDESDGNRDKYTNVSASYEEDDSNYEYVVEINEDELVEDEDDYLFEDTKVPVIPIELYNMAVGNIDIFDVNFLTGQDEGNTNSVWLVLRAIVSKIVHIILYVSAALLITLLIWHGVQLVLHSMDGAQARAKNKEGINRLAVSFAMLVGSVFIMAICIFSSQAVFNTTGSDLYDYSSDELPIRVHVKLTKKSTDEYSFSTNITGYVRFMAEIENPDRCTEKWGYVVLYIIMVLVNCAISLIMFVRMIIMWGLSMIGPLLAVFYAMNLEDKMPMKYGTWAKIYILLSMIQVVMALIYKVILVTMFTS